MVVLSQLAEVNACDFWDNTSDINFRYCAEHCRMRNEEGTQFLMDGLSYGDEEYMLGAAREYGCTEDFKETGRLLMGASPEPVGLV